MSLWNKKESQIAIVTSSSQLCSALQNVYGIEEKDGQQEKYCIFYFPKTSFADATLRESENFRKLKNKAEFFDDIFLAFEPGEEGEAEKAEFIKCFGKANYHELDTKQNDLKKVLPIKVREDVSAACAIRKQAAEDLNRKVQETLSQIGKPVMYDYRVFPLLMEIYLKQKEAEKTENYQALYIVHAKNAEKNEKRITLKTFDKRILSMEKATVTLREVQKKRITKEAPNFYHTLEFLEEADKNGISYYQVMTMLEMLYRNGLIPFYKTNGTRIPESLRTSLIENTSLAFPTNDFFRWIQEHIKNRELPQRCICEKNEASGICLRHNDAVSLFSIYDMAAKEERQLLDHLVQRQFAVYFDAAIEECYQFKADCAGVELCGEKSCLLQAGWKTAYGESSASAESLFEKEEFLIDKIEKLPFAQHELMTFQSLCQKIKVSCCGDTYEILRIFDLFFHRQKNPWLITESGYYLLNDEGKTFFASFEGKPQAFSLSVMTYLWQLTEDAKEGKLPLASFQRQRREKEDRLVSELKRCISRT